MNAVYVAESLRSFVIEFRKERTFDLTNCKNCGAPLPGYPCKCEYCGTVYDNAIGSGVAGGGPYQMHVGCLDKLLMTGTISINDYRRILLSEY